ncbi:MAG: J domain-containing protein [Planctomycetota bacterium]|nr:MAG: J domain-containing protein [Planctomycetota bacterium]
MPQDLYGILGVPRNASPESIRARYKELARELHPDVNPAGEDRFKEVSAAYGVLSDPERRALYDEFGEAALQAGFDRERAESLRRFGGGGFDFSGWARGAQGGGLDEILSSLLGGAFGARVRSRSGAPAPRGADLSTEVAIDLPLAVRGGSTSLRVDLPGREHIELKVPAGVRDGQTLRLKGLGERGPGGPGDLLVRVRVLPHPVYRREGDDLHVDVPVTLAEALRGGEVRFGGPTGEVRLRLPAGTRSGQSFRLRGLGVGGKGDLYARVLLATPELANDADAAARERLVALADDLAAYYPADPRVQVQF